MRWYCVHPNLPLQAELRIRAAPDSSAPEQGRLSQGRAVATGSSMLQASENDDDTTPASWLRVAYLDAASGEMQEGFVMAALPNGMPLVTPWEITGYRGCCEVMDPVTLMFDGPQDAAQSLGAVQSVEFLYCMMEESKTRMRIFHPKLESVWIDKKSLQVVCTRLEHEECSTPHAFYEMNDKLPKEAQIAVREVPSKEAHVVGLLSRDETLEVTMRSENWLQIVGGSLDKAWIMFRTDALELLQEARDVCSSNCRMIQRDDFVDDESATNQAFCANMHMVNSKVVEEQAASAIVSEAGHELGAALEVDDVRKMGDEYATVMVDGFAGMTVNVDTAEHLQAWEDRPFHPAQRVAVDDDSASDTAALRTDVTDDAGDTSVSGSALDTDDAVVEPVHAVQATDDQPVHSESFTHGEANADAVDDVAAAKNVGVHSSDTNLENIQMGRTRRSQPARAISYEIGDDDSSIASDDMGSCKKYDMKETENGEPAQTVASQGDHPPWPICNAPDSNDAVGKAVANAVHPKATMIITDVSDNNAVGADSSWDDRPIRPARKTPADSSCSTGTGTFAVIDERGTVTEPGALLWNDSLRITAKLNDEIGNNSDATAVISANNVGHDIAGPVQNVESWDNLSIRPAPLDCDEVQVGNEDMTTGNVAVNYVTDASCVDECANGKNFELWSGRPHKPARAQPEEVGANSSSTAHVDRGGPASRSNAKDSAVGDLGLVHVKQLGRSDRPVRPAQTVFDRTGGNDADDDSTIVSELAVIDTVDSSDTCVNLHVANFKREAARPSPQSDRPVDHSSQTMLNEADDESVDRGCDNLCFRHTYVVCDEIDCNDGTGALAGKKEAKSNVVEPSLWDQRSIWPEQSMRDVPPDSDVTRKRTGAAVADANISDVPSANDDMKEFVQVGNDLQNNLALKDCFAAEGVGSAVVTGNVLATAISVGDSTIADETHFKNVRRIVMDEAEEAKRVQIAISQDHPFALDGSAIVFSGAGIETVQDRHNLQSMTRLSVFERRYAESETTSGSENDEIALLGGLEDVFDPVDEWLSAMQEEDNVGFRDGNLDALPVAIGTETLRSRGNAIHGEHGEQSDSSIESNSACHSAEEKTQTGVAVQPAGISFLQAFGIRKYCEHKQNLITSADQLSLAMYEANQDDSDLLFQVLVGDDSLSDDWFYDVSSRDFQAYRHSSLKDVDLQSAAPQLTFDLIMSGASPEDILAAEQSDDDCGDFDLVISFKYPVPRRKVIEPSRPPAPFGRVPSAPVRIDTKTVGATIKSRTEAIGASSVSPQPSLPSHRTSTETSQEAAITAVTYSKTALSKQSISQPKIPAPRSKLRQNSVMAPVAISKPPSSLVRLRPVMQPLHDVSPVSSADSASSGFAPPLEASAASICATSTSSLAPSTRSFFQRRGFASTPSTLRALSAPRLARNSMTSSKPTEVSSLSASRKSFGFRHPLGLTRNT